MSAIIKNWFNIIIRLPIIAAICFFLMQTCCNLSLKGFFVPQNNIYQTVLIDSRFTDREVKLIIGVTEEWSIKTHGVVKYNIITGFDVEMYHQLDSSRTVLVIFKMSKDDIEWGPFLATFPNGEYKIVVVYDNHEKEVIEE